MNYSALIENRKSVRKFTDKKISASVLSAISKYYLSGVKRLEETLETQLQILGSEAREALEGAAGYHQFLVGAPAYLVLLTEKSPLAHLNAGFIMEDLVLKLTEMDLNTCWVTFTDSDAVKKAVGLDSHLDIAAIVAFGYGEKAAKRLRLNILSMSNIDISAKRHYFEPKRSVHDLVYLNEWGNTHKLDDYIGFFDDMLWDAFYAASLSPSYLNRQAYGFLIHDSAISLVSRPDSYNTQMDADLSLGIVLLHFTAVAEHWAGSIKWDLSGDSADMVLPHDHKVVATCML